MAKHALFLGLILQHLVVDLATLRLLYQVRHGDVYVVFAGLGPGALEEIEVLEAIHELFSQAGRRISCLH